MTHQEPVSPVVTQRRKWTAGRWALVAGGLLALVAAIVWALAYQGADNEKVKAEDKAQTEEQLKEAVEAEKNKWVEYFLDLCEGKDAAAKKLQAAGRCGEAREAQEATPEQLVVPEELVRRVVREELAANPPPAGRSPTPEDILPAVRSEVNRWLTANPPEDGRDGSTPSDARLLTLIRAVYAENPPEDGTDGQDGQDGQNGTDGQTPPCMFTEQQCQGRDGANGVDGADGQPGRGVEKFALRDMDDTPVRRDCVWVITYDDGTTQTIQAGDRACEDGQQE